MTTQGHFNANKLHKDWKWKLLIASAECKDWS